MTAVKKTPVKPNPGKPSDVVGEALASALAAMIGIVETMALAGVGQGVAGAQAAVGGVAAEAGQSSQTTQTGAAHKNDVSVPEITESYNLSGLNDNAHVSKVNARTFDITSAILNGMLAGHVANMNQQQANVTTHADEEYSARKRATEIGLVTVGDAVEEGADDTDRA